MTFPILLRSSSSETIIFMLLGVAVVTHDHEVHGLYVFLTVIFVLVYRSVGQYSDLSAKRHRGNSYLTSLPLVSFGRLGHVTRRKVETKISSRVQAPLDFLVHHSGALNQVSKFYERQDKGSQRQLFFGISVLKTHSSWKT